MIDWDHAILDDYYGLDKFCEMLDIKLKPYHKKMIWLSTKTNSFISTIMTDKISRPSGLKSEFFIIDEGAFKDGLD